MKLLWIRADTKEAVEAYDTWVVRWTSRHGSYSHSTRPETEVFPDKESADKFADALVDAFKLIRNRCAENKVTVRRGEQSAKT